MLYSYTAMIGSSSKDGSNRHFCYYTETENIGHCEWCVLSVCTVRSGVTRGGGWGVQTPHPEILKALQNRAKLNPIVKTVKIAEFRTSAPQDVRKKGSKILKLPRFTIVLH